MSDPTTDGLEATPAEIDGMVRNLCAYALGEPDPIQRYEGLTHQQALFEGMVEALRRERGRLVADLVVQGASVTEVAQRTSLGTVVKVRKLISLAGQTQRVNEATEARKLSSRQAEADARQAEASRSDEAAHIDEVGRTKEAAGRTKEAAGPTKEAAGRKVEVGRKVRKLIGLAGQTQRVEETTQPRQEAGRRDEVGRQKVSRRDEAERAKKAGGDRGALPEHLAVPNGKRLLTAADRAALGLPVESA